MAKEKGYIYILTNPSFKEYVKIGYADNVEKRLKDLNRSECVPFAFRVYATYEVNSRLSDKKLHSIIDNINPTLRSIDEFEGKKRVREFYSMTAEKAYSILEDIAYINGLEGNLKKIKPTKSEQEDEKKAQADKERLSPLKFSMLGIKAGEELEYCNTASKYNGEKCVVVSNDKVKFNNEIFSLSKLATILNTGDTHVAGSRYFKYKGEWLYKLREKMETENE